MKCPIEGIIFDLDGTLVDTLEDIAGSLNRTISHFNGSPRGNEEVLRYIGDGLKRLLDALQRSRKILENLNLLVGHLRKLSLGWGRPRQQADA